MVKKENITIKGTFTTEETWSLLKSNSVLSCFKQEKDMVERILYNSYKIYKDIIVIKYIKKLKTTIGGIDYNGRI